MFISLATRQQALDICKAHEIIYGLLYEGKITVNGAYIEKGDKWITENAESDLFRAILQARGWDAFTSDREIIALALALEL
jgi:hypothetical protein